MMDGLAHAVVWLNVPANALGSVLLAPIGVVPGWLSEALIGVVTGILLLLVFKYTSNQGAIKAARAGIKANTLALKLFKDNARVNVYSLAHILKGAGALLFHAIVPMVVMALPVTMLLAQLALWYQSRPLAVGEEAVVTLTLSENAAVARPEVKLMPTDALAVTIGPLKVVSKREVCWLIQARAAGQHRLTFQVKDQNVDKELAIGDGFMRVSMERPEWSWSAALFNPWEKPFPPESLVRSIEIDYPQHSFWWLIRWFAISLVAGFCCRGLLGVNI